VCDVPTCQRLLSEDSFGGHAISARTRAGSRAGRDWSAFWGMVLCSRLV
jgi:hypothetical protein